MNRIRISITCIRLKVVDTYSTFVTIEIESNSFRSETNCAKVSVSIFFFFFRKMKPFFRPAILFGSVICQSVVDKTSDWFQFQYAVIIYYCRLSSCIRCNLLNTFVFRMPLTAKAQHRITKMGTTLSGTGGDSGK